MNTCFCARARLSADVLPPVLTFTLGFISGAIATGFFKALGSDLYEKAKQSARAQCYPAPP